MVCQIVYQVWIKKLFNFTSKFKEFLSFRKICKFQQKFGAEFWGNFVKKDSNLLVIFHTSVFQVEKFQGRQSNLDIP